MSMPADRPWRRLAVQVAVSITLWATGVGILFVYLRWTLSPEAKAKAWTHPDSIGLPVVGFAVWFALGLVLANAIMAALALWNRRARRQRERTRAGRP